MKCFIKNLDRNWSRVLLLPALLVAVIGMAGHEAKAAAPAAALIRTDAFHPIPLPGPAASVVASGLGQLPAGRQVFGGVPFVLGAPLALTGMEAARSGQWFPTALRSPPFGRTARRLHLLHGTLGTEKDGLPLANLVLRYANGAEESLRLGYGVHTRTSITPPSEKKTDLADHNSRLAWSEGDGQNRNGELRLFHTALENPRPGEALTSIEIISLFSEAAPFLVALTAEEADSGLPPNRRAPLRKIARDLDDVTDSAYRRDFAVRVSDATGGAALTNATASLTVTDDQRAYYFGEVTADAEGWCRIPYPVQKAVGFHLLVRAPGRLPKVFSGSKTNGAVFPTEFTAALERGVTVGGVVKSAEGMPLAGAAVTVHRVVKNAPRDYTRVDYDTATTDANGRWTSTSLPAGFTGFGFEVAHPDFRSRLYAMPDTVDFPTNAAIKVVTGKVVITNAPPARPVFPRPVQYRQLPDGTMVPMAQGASARAGGPRPPPMLPVTGASLLATNAEMALEPAIAVAGVVRTADNQPLAQAEIIFQRNNPGYERQPLRTDAEGRFKLMTGEPGDGAVIVVRPGQTPWYQPIVIEPGMPSVELKLTPARILRGRVQDRQNAPVPGAKVRLSKWQNATDLLRFQTITDEEGRFTWTGAPKDEVTFQMTKNNYYSSTHSTSAAADEVTLSMSRPPSVSGKVYDAKTKKPVETFTVIPGRKYSQNEQQIRWDRSEAMRGRGGEYFVRSDSYGSLSQTFVMVEAPGYLPQISPPLADGGSHTNDFALKPGQGLRGVVQKTDGTPLAGAAVVLVEDGENAYMDAPGEFRSGSSYGDQTRTDAQGRFEFAPKLKAAAILAAHEAGFAEMTAAALPASGKIVLQPWGQVKGVMRVGNEPEPEQGLRLQRDYSALPSNNQRPSALTLYLRAEADAAGRFAYDRVPAGDWRVHVEYRFKERNYGETPLSHGQLVTVRSGQTTEVTLGGSGRRVLGQVKVLGGEQGEVDWKRDVHKLTLVPDATPETQPDLSQLKTPAEQQAAYAAFTQRIQAFWQSAAGQAARQAERHYVLLFDTNGSFRVEHVPPGKYQLTVIANDPQEEYYRNKPMGQLSKVITVPDVATAKINEAFDLGTLELPIVAKLRVGKPLPSFAITKFDGKPILLNDFKGSHVLLSLWGRSVGYSSYDFRVLKELQASYGAPEGKLVIIGLNLDPDLKGAADFVRTDKHTWLQGHVGAFGQSPVPELLGADSFPTALLLDPQGRLVARNLRSSGLRTAVENVLSGETPAARP